MHCKTIFYLAVQRGRVRRCPLILDGILLTRGQDDEPTIFFIYINILGSFRCCKSRNVSVLFVLSSTTMPSLLDIISHAKAHSILPSS
jgi:hypothetical protein